MTKIQPPYNLITTASTNKELRTIVDIIKMIREAQSPLPIKKEGNILLNH